MPFNGTTFPTSHGVTLTPTNTPPFGTAIDYLLTIAPAGNTASLSRNTNPTNFPNNARRVCFYEQINSSTDSTSPRVLASGWDGRYLGEAGWFEFTHDQTNEDIAPTGVSSSMRRWGTFDVTPRIGRSANGGASHTFETFVSSGGSIDFNDAGVNNIVWTMVGFDEY